jgi:hypothetical protein
MATIQRLIGVYDADGTVRGELTYFVGARLGRAHCALCDITHGLVRERRDWQACRDGLAAPVLMVHRDEMPPGIAAAELSPPFVLAETDDGVVPLLDGPALEACQGNPETLIAAIEAAVDAQGLGWPAIDTLGT